MQVDLFNKPPTWHYYIYTSLILVFIVFSAYALLRVRKRVIRFLRFMAYRLIAFWLGNVFKFIRFWLLKFADLVKDPDGNKRRANIVKNSDPEKQVIPASDDIPTVLKWAASSGRTDVVRNILLVTTKKKKLMPGVSGQALLMAIQNGHSEAANLLIDIGEGLSYTDETNATVLHWAARTGQSAICRQLLEKGASLGAKDQDDQTALDWAMRGNDEITINLLLKGGKNFTRQETANLQSLHFSARMGDLDTIKEFHKQGSSLEARDGKGQTVLFHAVKGEQHKIVQWLIDEGDANVHARDKEGLTALHVAAQGCNAKTAKTLIERGADVNALSSRNLTPLQCIPNSDGVRILMLLHEKGADINAFDKDNNRITHKAARNGDPAALLFSVARDLGADLEAPGAQGNTPAHFAAESGSKMILSFLSVAKIDFEKIRNLEGYTPLMMASRAGKIEVMRNFLEKGFSYNVVDCDGRSLIELSIKWNNPDVMFILQQYGADYGNVTVAGGDVHPVWKAVCEGQSASVGRLLDGVLSIEYEYRGVRILQSAIEANNEEVARLLIERGARVNVADMHGWTALHSAAYSGNVEIFLLVLQKTDDKMPTDQQGWTPLDLAAFYKHDVIVKMLDPENQIKEFEWMKANPDRINATNYYHPLINDSVLPGFAEV